MERLGIAFSGGPSPAEIVDCIALAESLGYESAWVAEGHGGDQFAILAAAAARTSRIRLGTSITSVFVRTAPTIAMAAASVDDISGGRFILGIGSSHKVQVEAEHGVSYAKPLTRVRETVAVIRDLLRDGRVQFRGETVKIERFDLWFAPRRPPPPVYVSAVFPKMIALCGEIADGIMLTRSTLDTAAGVREQLAEGARRAGRDPSNIVVSSLLPTMAIRLICSMDGSLCLRSATTSFWHARCRRGPSTPTDDVAMADLTGETDRSALRLDFDRRLMLQFHGSAITPMPGYRRSAKLILASQSSGIRWMSSQKSSNLANVE